jgi:hypothetical protein
MNYSQIHFSTSLLYLEAWETGLTYSGNGTAMHGSNNDQLLKAILHIYDIANMCWTSPYESTSLSSSSGQRSCRHAQTYNFYILFWLYQDALRQQQSILRPSQGRLQSVSIHPPEGAWGGYQVRTSTIGHSLSYASRGQSNMISGNCVMV